MSKRIDVINEVKDKIIEIANENGIVLINHFDNVDEFKKFVLAVCFKSLTDQGVPVPTAFDAVFGKGRYEEMVDEIYGELRK